MTFVGTAPVITASFDGLTFVPEAEFAGDAAICMDVRYPSGRTEVQTLCADRVARTNLDSQPGARAAFSMKITVTPVNDPPATSAIADRVVVQDTVVDPIPLLIQDVDGPGSGPAVHVTSSNEVLVPNVSLVLRGTGAERTLTIVPRANAVGATVITITANDGASSTTARFALEVVCRATTPPAEPRCAAGAGPPLRQDRLPDDGRGAAAGQ